MERVKWICVIVLWTAWVVILALRWVNSPASLHVPLKFVSGQRLYKTAPMVDPGVPRVVAWRPRRHRNIVPEPKNIFAPLAKPHQSGVYKTRSPRRKPKHGVNAPPAVTVYVPPIPPVQTPTLPSPEELATQQRRQQLELAAQQARHHLAQYRLVGYLMALGKPRAFLGKGNDLYIVEAGDLVEGQIHVASIDETRLILRDGGSTVERAILLNDEHSVVSPAGLGQK